jgi:hypothetical protein
MAEPAAILCKCLQDIEEVLSVEIISENGMAGVATGGDVIKSTWILDS